MSISELFRTSGVVPVATPDKTELKPKISGDEFRSLVEQELKLSQHAETRIRSRDLPWGPDMERRISSGINAAEAKGSREALIIAGDVAVIANVKSRTIITAMDKSQMKEKVFTNIDSAVLV